MSHQNFAQLRPKFHFMSLDTMDDLITVQQVFKKINALLGSATTSLDEYKVIYRHYYQDKSFREIGDELKMSRDTVRRLHNKAILNLKLNLTDYFSTDITHNLEAA